MRVLLQNSLFPPQVIGGAEIAVQMLAEQLARRGWHVDALASTGTRRGSRGLGTRPLAGTDGLVYEAPSAGLQDLYADGAPAPQVPLPVRALHHFAAVHSPHWLKLAGAALDRARPDLLHTNTIVGLTPAVWQAAGERGIPVIHTLHDYHLLCARTTLLRSSGRDCTAPPLPCRVLASLKLARTGGVRVVTAPSRFVLQRHLDAGGFPGARAEVVPNACAELPADLPDRRAFQPRGIFLGQLAHHKGVPALLGALAQVFADPRCAAFGFDFAGAGPLQGQVAAFCAAHGGRARFHGLVAGQAKRDLLAGASVLTVPSVWQDNFPMVTLEALAWGLPVVGARRGGIPEVIRDGQEGLIVEPTAADLADAVRRYALDAALRRTHGEAARRRAAEFTRDRQVDRFEALYRTLLAEDRP